MSKTFKGKKQNKFPVSMHSMVISVKNVKNVCMFVYIQKIPKENPCNCDRDILLLFTLCSPILFQKKKIFLTTSTH